MAIPKKDIDRMVALYEAGWSLSQIAAAVYWSPMAISRNLRLRGVQMRPRGTSQNHLRLTQRELTSTVRLYRHGLSMREVANRLGVTYGTIRHRLLRADEPIRTQSQTMAMQKHRRAA